MRDRERKRTEEIKRRRKREIKKEKHQEKNLQRILSTVVRDSREVGPQPKPGRKKEQGLWARECPNKKAGREAMTWER